MREEGSEVVRKGVRKEGRREKRREGEREGRVGMGAGTEQIYRVSLTRDATRISRSYQIMVNVLY